MAEIPVTSLTIGIAATPDDRRRLARLLGDTEAFLIVSSVDQARKFLDIVSSPESATTTAAEITRGAAAVRDTDPGSVGGDAVFAGGVAGDAVITHRTADDQPDLDGTPVAGGTRGAGGAIGDSGATWQRAARVAGDGIGAPYEEPAGAIRVPSDSSGPVAGGFQAAGRMQGMGPGSIGTGSVQSMGAGGAHGVRAGSVGAGGLHGSGAGGTHGTHSPGSGCIGTGGVAAGGIGTGGMHGARAGGVGGTHGLGIGGVAAGGIDIGGVAASGIGVGIGGVAPGGVGMDGMHRADASGFGGTHGVGSGGGLTGGAVVSGAMLAGQFVVTSHAIQVGAPPAAGPTTPAEPPVLRVDSDRRVLRWQDREIDLTPLEHDFLNCLIASPGQIWTYKRLHLEVWGNEHLGRGSDLHSVVRRIRRKLAWLGASAHIQAVRGVGFRYRDT